jgi:hypothetical protein
MDLDQIPPNRSTAYTKGYAEALRQLQRGESVRLQGYTVPNAAWNVARRTGQKFSCHLLRQAIKERDPDVLYKVYCTFAPPKPKPRDELTPAMIKTGAYVLSEHADEQPAAIVARIWRAMRLAQSEGE